MRKITRYDMGKRLHNGRFVGWAIWQVHEGCMDSCCPTTVAEFYGPTAFQCAKTTLRALDLITKFKKEKSRETSLKFVHQPQLRH